MLHLSLSLSDYLLVRSGHWHRHSPWRWCSLCRPSASSPWWVPSSSPHQDHCCQYEAVGASWLWLGDCEERLRQENTNCHKTLPCFPLTRPTPGLSVLPGRRHGGIFWGKLVLIFTLSELNISLISNHLQSEYFCIKIRPQGKWSEVTSECRHPLL